MNSLISYFHFSQELLNSKTLKMHLKLLFFSFLRIDPIYSEKCWYECFSLSEKQKRVDENVLNDSCFRQVGKTRRNAFSFLILFYLFSGFKPLNSSFPLLWRNSYLISFYMLSLILLDVILTLYFAYFPLLKLNFIQNKCCLSFSHISVSFGLLYTFVIHDKQNICKIYWL